MYSEKATKFCEISTIDLKVTTYDKYTVEISQKIVAFSKYMNFNKESAVCTLNFILLHFTFYRDIYLVVFSTFLVGIFSWEANSSGILYKVLSKKFTE